MSDNTYKLICETPSENIPLEVIWEEQAPNEPKSLFLTGPFMGAGVINKNERIYPLEEIRREVSTFNEKIIRRNSFGELNHPEHANIDLDRAAHLITHLNEDNGVWYGKSKIMAGHPCGEIATSLIKNGASLGMSSRCLGQLVPGNGFNTVKNMRLVTVDIVADPSFDKAFVNGILESKQFVCVGDGIIHEKIYDRLDSKLNDLPKANQNEYIKDALIEFIKNFGM